MAKHVRAIQQGFYKGVRIRAGQEFTIDDNAKLGKWMEEIKPAKTEAAPAKPSEKPEAAPAKPSEKPARGAKGEGGEGLV